MDDDEYDHLVADKFQVRLPSTRWREYAAPSVDHQAKRYLAEYVGLEIELDQRTTVFRVQEDMLVYIE